MCFWKPEEKTAPDDEPARQSGHPAIARALRVESGHDYFFRHCGILGYFPNLFIFSVFLLNFGGDILPREMCSCFLKTSTS